LITRISVIGITAITAALVILLSAFNGIEEMITKLYSEFDPDLSIRIVKGKSFDESRINFIHLSEVDGVERIAKGAEEEVILKHEDKWANATLLGVDSNFLSITKMEEHIIEGKGDLLVKNEPAALIGASLLDKLEGFIPANVGHESLIFYAPKRKIKIGPGKNPFFMQSFKLNGRYNFNREVNASTVILPLEAVQKFTEGHARLTVVFVDVRNGKLRSVQEEIQNFLGSDFSVKSNLEKNELIFKTSKSEKLIVILILVFIFILAAFNLVASLIMLFVEKKNDMNTLFNMGADRSLIFRIFFIEGLLIAFKGILLGALIGYGVCFLQIQFGLLTMPNTGGEVFPMALSFKDGLLIFALVTVLSIIFSYFPVKYLVKNSLTN
jgi:lipoprotein-releasing system permease protein